MAILFFATLFLIISVNLACNTETQCLCSLDKIISNITHLPVFSDSDVKNVLYLDIKDTKIKLLPNFNTWPSLVLLTVFNNTLLKCENTPMSNHKFVVINGCNQNYVTSWPGLISLPDKNYEALYSLYSIPVILCILIFYLGKLYKKITLALNISQENVCNEIVCSQCVQNV